MVVTVVAPIELQPSHNEFSLEILVSILKLLVHSKIEKGPQQCTLKMTGKKLSLKEQLGKSRSNFLTKFWNYSTA